MSGAISPQPLRPHGVQSVSVILTCSSAYSLLSHVKLSGIRASEVKIWLNVSLTFLITPNHRIALETRQIPMGAQPEVILGPLENSLLVNDATR